jgi:hypothetical protein
VRCDLQGFWGCFVRDTLAGSESQMAGCAVVPSDKKLRCYDAASRSKSTARGELNVREFDTAGEL